MDEDEVTRLPVKFKRHDEEVVLQRVQLVSQFPTCNHYGSYIVDEAEAEVTCGRCGEKLNPMWVLQQLANKEHQWHRVREQYQEEMKRLDERSRTKCQHCGKMTSISRR